jgi:hypothetical protein
MPQIHYLGKDTAAISNMPMIYSSYKSPEKDFDDLRDILEKAKFKYQFAITADTYQHKNHEILISNGFKPKLSFLSSHGKQEALTLWLKIRKTSPKLSDIKISHPLDNCTVTYNRNNNMLICNIAVKQNNNDILPFAYRRIPNTPIYFKINDKHIVKGRIKKLNEFNDINEFTKKKYR